MFYTGLFEKSALSSVISNSGAVWNLSSLAFGRQMALLLALSFLLSSESGLRRKAFDFVL
jgi:hypothetical protein